MASAESSGFWSGAAQGASVGAMTGNPMAIAGGAIIGGVAGLFSGRAKDAQFKNQNAWAEYNSKQQRSTDYYNINSQFNIAQMNAGSILAAANIQSGAIEAATAYNQAITYSTIQYNDALAEQNLQRVWQDEELELEQLHRFRARERGTMIADQASSGTLIGEGSNADVVISQQTQEAMDAFIVESGADRQAADINNQRAQSRWQGSVAISQMGWEGAMQSYVTKANAGINAASTLATAKIARNAGIYSADQGYQARSNDITLGKSAFSAQNTQDMMAGMFKAAGTAVGGYYANKVPVGKASSKAPSLLSSPSSANYPGAYSTGNLSLMNSLGV